MAGCERAERQLGISWLLIPDVSPHMPAHECHRAMAEVLADLLMGALTQAARLLARDRSPAGRRRVDEALDALLHGIID